MTGVEGAPEFRAAQQAMGQDMPLQQAAIFEAGHAVAADAGTKGVNSSRMLNKMAVKDFT
jgi:hypothetical protein